MCGRFARINPMNIIAEYFNLQGIPIELLPSYNIAPTQQVAGVVFKDGNKLEQFRWGLIPAWAKDPSIGNKMINARAETIREKPSLRNAFKKRRCLVVADGFFEWKKTN